MRYLFLGYSNEKAERELPAEELERVIALHADFGARMRAEGRFVAGVGLADSAETKVVRRAADGGDLVTDGPFAETAEQIGGLYILECADHDEAIALARRIPFTPGLTVEVRRAPA
ncbi:YciI family protein [Phytomonospora sp. NPDC050363]|uniref:YciI family protein n=1 Tax=Phytomonospora sp. NPDC050363 TaxID=3155642 RepID=UPI0033D144B2